MVLYTDTSTGSVQVGQILRNLTEKPKKIRVFSVRVADPRNPCATRKCFNHGDSQ